MSARLRPAELTDGPRLLALWTALFATADAPPDDSWREHARAWFADVVTSGTTCFPVVEVDETIVATAVGTLQIGVPNPWGPRGRTVRLSAVITVPEHRRNGYGTMLVGEIVRWGRSVEADRVDLSATDDGRRVYERMGFVAAPASGMRLVLAADAAPTEPRP